MSDRAPSAVNDSPKPGRLDRLARRLVIGRLAGMRRGQICLCEEGGQSILGESADLQATLRVHRPRFFRDAVLGGELSIADAYIRGLWDCDDLTSLFRIFLRNSDSANRLNDGLAKVAGIWHRLYEWTRANTRAGSRRNIAAHYDLGNEFYKLWLDETLAYSSGIFVTPEASMRDASVEKFDRVCRKLDLRPDDHLVEIGTGWGGLAIHAARTYDCRVTTTTISEEQFKVARRRIDEAGLANRITLLKQDYRDLQGQFDKLVSIEMIEAVGHQYLDGYFRKCSDLLRPEGTMVLQAIVMPERVHAAYLKNVDFIRHYVFPGGCLPSVAGMLESSGRATDLRFVHAEDFAPHYAETLRRWHSAFLERLPEVRRLGYPPEFLRLWEYYLCYCEAAFEERFTGVLQVQFDKPLCRRDPIRLSERAAVRTRPVLSPGRHPAAAKEHSSCGAGACP